MTLSGRDQPDGRRFADLWARQKSFPADGLGRPERLLGDLPCDGRCLAFMRADAAGDLSRRVPDYRPRTEVGRLAAAFNTMLGRIEAAYRARAEGEARAQGSEERMRLFVADARHELRTPLTVARLGSSPDVPTGGGRRGQGQMADLP
jgi:signal transduction histidine kinase